MRGSSPDNDDRPKPTRRRNGDFIPPEAIAAVASALGIPVAAVFGNLLLAGLLGFITLGVFLRFKRRARRQRT